MIRSLLHVSRDMPFVKVVRSMEEDARGIRPVTVQFEKHAVSTYCVKMQETGPASANYSIMMQ